MGTTTINGLPAHPLWVHAVVVLVPLSALVLVVCAAWPAVMRRTGVALPLLALVALASVPLATDAGESLQERVPETAAVEHHTEMGGDLLPWSVGIFAVAVVLWVVHRGFVRRVVRAGGGQGGTWVDRLSLTTAAVRVVAVVLALVVGVGAVVQVYRIGDSGAKAVWQGR
ncbi:DUF2231 domain-containing protein [Actinacidiphila acidipaludis]|uniref:DUF2231 domain-containing protein n=1 Tax=Actinacidiphila acidipaludis TaxID=2873382 RepID=A0ABS7Q2E5_9ACTN|nr:DUF2231 domain-containing protein [Streptomyces acidipaludis]MBY8877314.1 hypothetical protein [Streptomyces acidipaludis]